MNGPVNTTAAGKSAVGRVDHGVDLLKRDVSPDKFQGTTVYPDLHLPRLSCQL